MRSMSGRAPFLVAGLSAVAIWIPANARAEPKLLVTDQAAGVVLDFTARDGSDVSATPFATGLGGPGGICVGPENQLFVAEFGSGEITIATDGGDLADASPFAFVDPMVVALTPAGLWCDESTVVMANSGVGASAVVDITAGGEDFVAWTIHVAWPGAVDVPGIVDLARAPNGKLVTSSTLGVYDADVDASASDRALIELGAGGENVVPLELLGERLLGGAAQGNVIYDLTDAAFVDEATTFATVPIPAQGGVLGLLDAGEYGLFAATYDGIFDITGGGDHSGDAPIATGLSGAGLGLVDMVLHECTTDDDCADGDLCNGDEPCVRGRCEAPLAPLGCDDEDVCTADSCDPNDGCGNVPIDNCCASELDCALGEVCDPGDNRCVEVEVPPSDTETTDSAGGSGSESGDDGGLDFTDGVETDGPPQESETEGSSATDGPDAADDTAGCGCTSSNTVTSKWFLLACVLLLRRRTKRFRLE